MGGGGELSGQVDAPKEASTKRAPLRCWGCVRAISLAVSVSEAASPEAAFEARRSES